VGSIAMVDSGDKNKKKSSYTHMFDMTLFPSYSLFSKFVLPTRLTETSYCDFLQNYLHESLDEIPLNIIRRMWFMHDGAPSHFSREASRYLDERFPDR